MLVPRSAPRLLLVVVLALAGMLAAAVPVAAGPEEQVPVVYVAGSADDLALANLQFADPMRQRGFDVHVFLTLDPADPANNPYVTIKGNSRKLADFVQSVRHETGSDRVDVVGVSQTGLVVRYWLKDFGGDAVTRRVVLLSGIVKGSTEQQRWIEEGQCPPADRRAFVPEQYRDLNPTPACLEQAYGGAEVTRLNTPLEALPGIEYFNVTTLQEFEAAPYRINLMDGPGDHHNIVTQDLCPNDPVLHLTMSATPSVHSLVEHALGAGEVRMDCMVPVVPGLPTLKDAIVPIETTG